jgi:hypothetical protein
MFHTALWARTQIHYLSLGWNHYQAGNLFGRWQKKQLWTEEKID